jgi:hypothetical protein
VVSLIGAIVNEKLRDEGVMEIDEVAMFRRMEQANSLKQKATPVTDQREALRVKWLSYANQKKNFLAWERLVVEKKRAQPPVDEGEQNTEGHVVFYEGQRSNIVNMDEMKISLSGKDESIGGRPGMSHTTAELNEAGRVQETSTDVATLMVGIAGDEPLPILFICPTSQKWRSEEGEPKLYRGYQQVKGQYGYPHTSVFDCCLWLNKK